MVPPIKTKAISGVLLLLMLIQCYPGVAMGYDVIARIKDFVSLQVEQSDKIINSNKPKIKASVNKGTEWIGKKTLDGFSYLENKTGLNEKNNLYKAVKDSTLHNVGFKLGLINGAGDITSEMYSLAAKVPTAPERIVNFGYNYAENPKKYQSMVINGAKTVAGVISNPMPLYQQGKSTYYEAAKNPLKLGNLHGEATAFLGSFLIGGGQVKTVTTAPKIQKVAQVSKTETLLGIASSTKKTSAKGVRFECSLSESAKDISFFAKVKEYMILDAGNVLDAIELKTSKVLEKLDSKPPKKFTFEDLDAAVINGTPLPMTKEAVDLVAKMAGIGLDGINVNIIRIKPILYSGKGGYATHKGITLYPAAFKNFYTLCCVLGHERTHMFQIKLYKVDTIKKTNMYRDKFEKAADVTQRQWVDYFSNNCIQQKLNLASSY